MITQKDIDAQGNVTLWEKHEDGIRQVKLPATDAIHALQADPERWSLDGPAAPAPELEAEAEAEKEDE